GKLQCVHAAHQTAKGRLMIDPTIFKAYDVRGTYPDQMNEEAAYAIGAAFIAHFGVLGIAVGRDMRLSSPALFEAFKDGVTAQDVHRFVDGSTLRPLKLAIDAGNGMAGLIVPAAFKGLPVQIEPLYFDPDGHFPHHPASPIEPENMVDVQRLVRETDADMGVAFDGDADRMFITDEHGELVDGGMVTAMVARNLLKKNPGATILYNLIVSKCVPELIARLGGRGIRTRVGHSFIKAQMREYNAIFG